MDVSSSINKVVDNIKQFLLEKNQRYGNSALDSCQIFDKILNSNKEDITTKKILIRITDKLKRIENSDELKKNDITDIIRYLILICVKKEWNDFKDLLD
ncbi:Uncharacterised protein [uncultured archaeon]|nr:Uncharacterised protein [uncultured archaeon]